MSKHTKQIIGAILSAAVVLFVPTCWLFALLFADLPTAVSLIGFAFSALWLFAGLSMLKERIKEIRSGEQDDLSQY